MKNDLQSITQKISGFALEKAYYDVNGASRGEDKRMMERQPAEKYFPNYLQRFSLEIYIDDN